MCPDNDADAWSAPHRPGRSLWRRHSSLVEDVVASLTCARDIPHNLPSGTIHAVTQLANVKPLERWAGTKMRMSESNSFGDNSVANEINEGVPERFGAVIEHGRNLIRLELALVTDRVRRRMGSLQSGLKLYAVAAVLGVTALLILTGALIGLLATIWPVWVAAMVVAVALGVLAALVGRAATLHLKDQRAWLASSDDEKERTDFGHGTRYSQPNCVGESSSGSLTRLA